MKYKCLLFDLDGTLVDSRADLAHAINLMLAELGRASLPDAMIISFVGEGAPLLVERALRSTRETAPQNWEIESAMQVFARHYRAHLLDRTTIYPEVEETLVRLAAIAKAVVTNKPYEWTIALLDGIGLSKHFAAILGGDSMSELKPSPRMLLEAARRCSAEPSLSMMIGDTRVDVAAGKAAGMKTCGYVSGFRGRTELEEAGADYLIERFSELVVLVS